MEFIETLELLWLAFLQCLTGIPMALLLTFGSVVFGVLIAIPCAIIMIREKNIFSMMVRGFVFFFTGSPLLVQLYIFYFGFAELEIFQFLQNKPGFEFLKHGFVWVLLALTFNTAAYSTNLFAGAIRNMDKKEIEAAKAYGMGRWTRLLRVTLPSSLRRALPAYSNECILIMHATALANTVTVVEITSMASRFNQEYYQPFVAYGAAALVYLLMTFFLTVGFRRMEFHYLRHLRVKSVI